MSTHFEIARQLELAGLDFVVVTLLAGRGHIPQDVGAKAIVTSDGLRSGTVGGGKVEARAIAHARVLLESRSSAPESVTWNLQKDIGMTCGGEVTYLFEAHLQKSWRVRIFGAGHVAQALIRVLAEAPVALTCIDPRAEWMAKLPHSQANLEAVLVESPASWVESTALQADEFFVVLTQGHATDVPVLEQLFRKFPEPRYIGVIGSETKGVRIRAELKSRGVTEESLALLRVPIGLDIGSNHPAEIAISIAAELLQVRGAGPVPVQRPDSKESDFG